MTEHQLQLIVEMHLGSERQGPGSEEATNLALQLTQLNFKDELNVLDIGSGTGAQTLQLATRLPNSSITAVDIFSEFLDELKKRAKHKNLENAINPLIASMDKLPFNESSFDLIWSEGAIYNIGFETGIKLWTPLLKENGVIAISEITWKTKDRPQEIEKFWSAAYPEISVASDKIKILEANGLSPLGYFVLKEDCWLENYYSPLIKKAEEMMVKYEADEDKIEFIKQELSEVNLYKRYSDYYSYGFYIARKTNKQ